MLITNYFWKQWENFRKQEGNVFQLDLDTSEEDKVDKKANNTNDKREETPAPAAEGKAPKNVVTYANTSVLKHLLHRYTETKQ